MEEADQFGTEVQLFSVARSFTRPFGEGTGEVQIGKAAYHLGRGRLGTLLSMGTVPGYPSISYRLTGPRYTYQKVLGDLGTSDQAYKRLGLHYFTYRLTPRLELGVGEAFVRSEPFPGDFFYDILPGLPYYLVKYVPGVASRTDNNLIYLDAEFDVGAWTTYGEFLVNEFPFTPGETNPPLYGLLLGAERGPWIVEYARLTNFAYSNGGNDGAAVYGYDGEALGHWLESDGDELDVRWTKAMGSGWTLQLGAFAKRKGEGDLGSWYSSLEDRKENAFLSGVVETTVGFTGRVERDLGDVRLYGEAKAGPVSNEDHQRGESGVFYEMKVGFVLGGVWD